MNPSTTTDTYPAGLPHHSTEEWRAFYDEAYPPNYGTRQVAIVRGEGTRVWDAEGREYIDFITGISVNNLGHCHPRITKAIQDQAETLTHCTNLFYIPVQIELARKLTSLCFADKVFFCNSGAEANETAIKLARRWGHENRGPDVDHIISMNGSFHGRTMATISASGQEKLWTNFHPLVSNFHFADLNDLNSVEKLVDDKTCAILIEPIQGEGGYLPATPEFLAGLRKLCDERNMLLIFDEIQTGFCRTGTMFAYEGYGVTPDIMTLAKSLGGGLAMGAMLTTSELASTLALGSHGTTMGGNALTSAAALAYVSELDEGNYAERVRETGAYFTRKLKAALEGEENVVEIRAFGMMIGVEVERGGPDAVRLCAERGLLINCTAGCVLRTHAPFNVSHEDIDKAIQILTTAIHETGKAE